MCEPSSRHQAPVLDRSTFLRVCAGSIGAAAVSFPSFALADNADAFYARYPDARVLWVKREGTDHTGNAFSYNRRIPFSLDGRSVYWKGYLDLCAVMRDVRVDPKVGDVYIDIKLINALYDVHKSASDELGRLVPIHLDSVFRTSETNLDVGGVTSSQHLWGKAADFYVPGLSTAETMDIALNYRRATSYRDSNGKLHGNMGGIGYYASDGHVHGDVGPFYTRDGGARAWGPWHYDAKHDY